MSVINPHVNDEQIEARVNEQQSWVWNPGLMAPTALLPQGDRVARWPRDLALAPDYRAAI